jgi:hypothetical protein
VPATDDDEDAPVLLGAGPQVSSGGTTAPGEDSAAETGTVIEPAAPEALPQATATPAAGTPQPATATPTAQPSPAPTETSP